MGFKSNEEERTQRNAEKLSEDRGRDWSDAATIQETQGFLEATRS